MNKKDFIASHNIDLHASGCWNWTKALTHNGYGRSAIKTKEIRAHRLSYQTFVGQIPPGMQVCHRCDNRKCVNPDHLFVSDQLGNMRDMIQKGRKVFHRNESHHSSKLTDAQVAAIRADSRVNRLIAADYGIHKNYVNVLKRGLRRV